jgi:antitoxin component YwqK of YwqJK toxin-antitoxin module
MKKLSSIIVILLIFNSFVVKSDEIHLINGEVYKNISNLRDLGEFYSFDTSENSYTFPKNKILKIVDSNNAEIYSLKKLVASKEGGTSSSPYLFSLNGTTLSKGRWLNAGEFLVISGTPPDGIYSEYFDTGDLRQIFTFKNGQLNGNCKTFFTSGTVEREGFFKNGKADGKSKMYYPDGKLKGVSEFKDGVRQGATLLYYHNGALKAKLNFKNGKAFGKQLMYFENGNPESLAIYDENGKKNGKVVFYYESGKIKKEAIFVNDKLDGIVTTYYESGRVKKRKKFSNGRVEEEWKN